MPNIEVHFIFPIIRTDFIKPAVASLYKYTDKSKFKLTIVDQSIEGLDKEWIDQNVDLYIRQKNAGFSNAANQGIIHALKANVPYIAICNDDILMMYSGWWEDALQEFDTDPHIVAVSPESPRIAMWGYGLTHGEYCELLPHKEEFTPEDIEYLKQGDYNKEEIQSRHPYTIPESFPFRKRGVIDGIAMWMPIFKREAFIELGLFDERFVWGGGEDYSMLARAYSCAWPIDRTECDPNYHRRMVSTMKSWVFHFWGQSKDVKETLNPKLFESREAWNNLDFLWPPEMNGGSHVDPWGHWTDEKGIKRPSRRIREVYVYKE